MTTNTRRRGRPPKAEAGDTKGALLEAALRLFAQNGYAGTSIRAIAREVGLSESVLYAHFAGKRAIFDAALERLGPQGAVVLLGSMDPALAESDPPAFIRTLVAHAIEEWSTPEARQLISLMAQDGMIHDPALVSRILEVVGELSALFARWIEAGHIREGLAEPEDLAYALLSPVAQARLLWLHAEATPEDIKAARERAARHADFFAKAVFA